VSIETLTGRADEISTTIMQVLVEVWSYCGSVLVAPLGRTFRGGNNGGEPLTGKKWLYQQGNMPPFPFLVAF